MHYTTRRFWQCYNALPESVQKSADESYKLLKLDPSHPSLQDDAGVVGTLKNDLRETNSRSPLKS